MIYLASSTSQRDQVKNLAAQLRERRFKVYEALSLEHQPSPTLPQEPYATYLEHITHLGSLNNPTLAARQILDVTDTVILLLPGDVQALLYWIYGIGRGAFAILLGQPPPEQYSLFHGWTDRWYPDEERFFASFGSWTLPEEPSCSLMIKLRETAETAGVDEATLLNLIERNLVGEHKRSSAETLRLYRGSYFDDDLA